MKQFNLEDYLRLKEEGNEPKIVTRDGRSARIICKDRKEKDNPVVALIENSSGTEYPFTFNNDGRYYNSSVEDPKDLFFADLDEEPKYRPFKDAEEFFAEMKKHGEWITQEEGVFIRPLEICNDKIIVIDGLDTVWDWSFVCMVKDAIWADDGSPCGIKEEVI